MVPIGTVKNVEFFQGRGVRGLRNFWTLPSAQIHEYTAQITGSTYQVKYGEKEEEIVKSLVDCLGGEDDEGEDVTDEAKAGDDAKKNSLDKEGKSVKPRGRLRKLDV